MRDAFARQMTLLAETNKNLILLSGDIGNRMFDQFKSKAPNRFINCGIAESNMMSVASGLALSGLRPVVYTITPFTTTRCLEQIKVGVAYHESSVVIVGTGSGLSYSELGPTHHSLEDIAILRSIPEIRICAPSDSLELENQLNEAVSIKGPTYIRIGKKGEPILHKNNNNLGIGKANILREGDTILVLAIGPIISEALKAAEELTKLGINLTVASMGSVVPLDSRFLKEMLKRNFKAWVTLEEHNVLGGLGSSILEWVSDINSEKMNIKKIKRCGVPNKFIHELGSQAYTRNKLGLDCAGIIKTIIQL